MRAALFDVDGTLLDSNDLHIEAWGRAFRDFGLNVTHRQLREQMGNGGERLVKALCNPEDTAHLSKALIERLRADGVRIAFASSAKKAERERHIEILGVRDRLDAKTSGESAEHAKPAPDIFQAALARLGGGRIPRRRHAGELRPAAARVGARREPAAPDRPLLRRLQRARARPCRQRHDERPAGDAPPIRAGICVSSRIEGAWIRSNRIWDNQDSRTQNEDLQVADGGECRDCTIDT